MIRSLNFEHFQGEANEWLYEVMNRLGIKDRDQAGRIFRAVLHALRDRVEPDQAANFASQLPIIWKGVFFDGFNPGASPVKIRNVSAWLDFIREKDGFAAEYDFPTDDHVASAFACVISALYNKMDPFGVDKLMSALPLEIQDIALASV